jgi:hypothetical protein
MERLINGVPATTVQKALAENRCPFNRTKHCPPSCEYRIIFDLAAESGQFFYPPDLQDSDDYVEPYLSPQSSEAILRALNPVPYCYQM